MGVDTVIVDTAGRLQIDKEMMEELARIKENCQARRYPISSGRDDWSRSG